MKRAHILVVENEQIISEVIKQYLEKDQFEVTVLNSGETVVCFTRVKNVDLILLGIGLPDKDGLKIYHEIRAFSEVPIIFICEKIEDVDCALSLDIAKNMVLLKPFLPREVVGQVKEVLKK